MDRRATFLLLAGLVLAMAKQSDDDEPTERNSALGYGAAVIAIVCFGSNFLPVKKYDTGDGMFFQWVMCAAIWIVSVGVEFYQKANGSTAGFEPIVCLGGALWCTGNLLCVPIIQCIGMGLGLLVWGGANMVTGWAGGYFGILFQSYAPVSNPALNAVGAVTCLMSLAIFFFVKVESKKSGAPDLRKPILQQDLDVSIDDVLFQDSYTDVNKSFFEKLAPGKKKAVGFSLAVVAGLFFGVNFNPALYLIGPDDCTVYDTERYCGTGYDRCEWISSNSTCTNVATDQYSTDPLDYIFAHFTGIFGASTIYFLIYCAYKKNKPNVFPQVILPAFFCGLGWAVAQVSWFIANVNISTVVSFPVVTTGPGIIGALWGIFLFGEIKGKRNFLIFGAAVAVTAAGIAMITASK